MISIGNDLTDHLNGHLRLNGYRLTDAREYHTGDLSGFFFYSFKTAEIPCFFFYMQLCLSNWE